MEEKLIRNDFIEIEYTGKVKNREIFDTNIPEQAKKIGLDIKTRPLIICLGQNMILPAIDKFLIGKSLGEYNLELKPEDAFGTRKRELIKVMPMSLFRQQKINPSPGMMFSFDNQLARISAVSGGRVIVDFNNPMAGKEIEYNIKVKVKIKDNSQKIKTLMAAFFQQEFEFKIDGNKIIMEDDKNMKSFIILFRGKFKEILNLDLEVKEKKPEAKEKKTSDKSGKNNIK